MVEEEVIVTRVTAGTIWVRKSQASACAGCDQTCSVAGLPDAAGADAIMAIASGDFNDLEVGDRVAIGIPERVLLAATLWLFLLPLAGLIIGALSGTLLGGSGCGDGPAIAGAALGLATALAVQRISPGSLHRSVTPALVRKLA